MRREVRDRTIADIYTGRLVPLVVYKDDHADDWHTHDVGGEQNELSFRYPKGLPSEWSRPNTVYTVLFDDINGSEQDKTFYSKDRADARAEDLNRHVWATYRNGMEKEVIRWAAILEMYPLSEETEAFLDAGHIASFAEDVEVREAARQVRKAFNRPTQGDPREALAHAEAQANLTFEEFVATGRRHDLWRVATVSITDAEAYDG